MIHELGKEEPDVANEEYVGEAREVGSRKRGELGGRKRGEIGGGRGGR